jgi:hypothetical protein
MKSHLVFRTLVICFKVIGPGRIILNSRLSPIFTSVDGLRRGSRPALIIISGLWRYLENCLKICLALYLLDKPQLCRAGAPAPLHGL